MFFSKRVFFIYLIFSLFLFASSGKKITERFGTVIFPSKRVYNVELAETKEQWIKGLMFRKTLPEKGGMLFIYPEPGFYAIWMKNCFISLDILWLDSKGKIIYIIENAPPCKHEPCEVYQPIMKSSYVLELRSGTVKKEKLRVGDRLDIVLPEKK